MTLVFDKWRRPVELRPSTRGRISVQQVAYNGSTAGVSKPQAFGPNNPVRQKVHGRSGKGHRTHCNECSSPKYTSECWDYLCAKFAEPAAVELLHQRMRIFSSGQFHKLQVICNAELSVETALHKPTIHPSPASLPCNCFRAPWSSLAIWQSLSWSRNISPLCDHTVLSSQQPTTGPCHSLTHPFRPSCPHTVSPRLASCLRSCKPRRYVKLR